MFTICSSDHTDPFIWWLCFHNQSLWPHRFSSPKFKLNWRLQCSIHWNTWVLYNATCLWHLIYRSNLVSITKELEVFRTDPVLSSQLWNSVTKNQESRIYARNSWIDLASLIYYPGMQYPWVCHVIDNLQHLPCSVES